MIGNADFGSPNAYGQGVVGSPRTPMNQGINAVVDPYLSPVANHGGAPNYIAMAQADGGIPVFNLGHETPLNATPEAQAVQLAYLPADSVVRKINFN